MLTRLRNPMRPGEYFNRCSGWFNVELHTNIDPTTGRWTLADGEWWMHVVVSSRVGKQAREQLRANGIRESKVHSVHSYPYNAVRCPAGCGLRKLDRDELVARLEAGDVVNLPRPQRPYLLG